MGGKGLPNYPGIFMISENCESPRDRRIYKLAKKFQMGCKRVVGYTEWEWAKNNTRRGV